MSKCDYIHRVCGVSMGPCTNPALPHMVRCFEHVTKDALDLGYKMALKGTLFGGADDFVPDTISILADLEEAKALLVELLKFGQHDGECDHSFGNGACVLHMKAMSARKAAVQEWLSKH